MSGVTNPVKLALGMGFILALSACSGSGDSPAGAPVYLNRSSTGGEESTPGPLAAFEISSMTSSTDVGMVETFTVRALDDQGKTKTDYIGTVQFSSDDGSATLPANYQFEFLDFGAKTFSSGMTFGSTGTFYLQVEDVSAPTITGIHSGIIVTNTQCPGRTIEFQQASSNGSEANTSVNFVVELSSTCVNDVSVDYTTNDGTAADPGDYTASNGTIVIGAGTTTKLITISVADDGDIESDETFTLDLSAPGQSTTLGTDVTHTYTILDDDGVPPCPTSTIGFTTASSSGDEGTTNVNLTVQLSQACPGSNVSVDYITSDVSATAGSDYVLASGTATILAGQTSTTIPLTITDDGDAESTESFKVTLSNAGPLNATLGLPVHTYSITDNDGGPAPCPGTVAFTTNSSNGLESVTNRVVNVEFTPDTPPCAQSLTVDYATADITAANPGDYTSQIGTLTFPAGVQTAAINIPVIDDSDVESNESLKVTLSNPSLAEVSLGISVHTATIVENDTGYDTFYVRTTGSDSNDGLSAANAFLTIGKAMATVAAGDTVFIGAGTYSEALAPPVNGAVGEPITFVGDVDGINTGDAGDVILDNSGGNILNLTGVEHMIFDRLIFENATAALITDFGGVDAVNISVRNCTIRDLGSFGVLMYNVVGFYIENNIIQDNNFLGVVAYIGSEDVEIKNNIFDGNMYGIYLGRDVSDVLIENNTIYGSTWYQIYLQGNVTATIRNNIVVDGGFYGIFDQQMGGPSTLTNSNNNVWNNATADYQNVTPGPGRIDADPLFVDPASKNFRVSPTSPTIDAGSSAASAVTFSDGSDLTSRSTRSDDILDGNTGMGDGTTVNIGFHY